MGTREALRTHRLTALALGVYALVFFGLALGSYPATSSTFDEGVHLTSGYVALQTGDFRLVPEHPPLMHLWAALPLAGMPGVRMPSAALARLSPTQSNANLEFSLAHEFLYRDNDADHLLNRARFAIVVVGFVLGLLLFAAAAEWFGRSVAFVVLALFATDANVLAHSSVVTTDMGVACAVFGSVYLLWRVVRRLTVLNVLMLAVAVGFALITKYSAVLLVPVLLFTLALQVLDGGNWECSLTLLRSPGRRLLAAAGVLFVIGLVAVTMIWAAYGFRYLPSPDPAWRFAFDQAVAVRAQRPMLTALVGAIDRAHLLPNAFTQGFLLVSVVTYHFPTYLLGQITRGDWRYFPMVFLLKTPLALLILSAAGLMVASARRLSTSRPLQWMVWLMPVLVFGGVLVAAGLDFGFRHFLPVYPFVIFGTGVAIRHALLARSRAWHVGLCLVALVSAAEFARVYPHNLSFFNTLAGGPSGGYRYFVESNLDWGQDLKRLAQWARERGVTRLNLAYFGTADPRYYGLECHYLPGSPFFAPSSSEPLLPGLVAVSETVQAGLYLETSDRDYYVGLRGLPPVATIGYSIKVYRVERPWRGLVSVRPVAQVAPQ